MSFLDDIEKGVEDAWSTVSTTGAPAVIAGAENYAAELLKKQATSNQAAAQAAVQKAVQAPGSNNGLLKSINGVMSQIAQGTVFKQYGLFIIAGVVVVMIVGRKML